MRQKPTQIIAEIRRVRERCPIFNPLICTAATASILGITPRQLRYRHRDLAVSFQEVVHSALTEEAEVAEASDSKGRTEWTPIRMRP
jgi:hypothetical protein